MRQEDALMAGMTTSPAAVSPGAGAHARTGPMIVAVGGAEPVSVLRAARVLAPNFDGGVLAVSVLEPLPIFSGNTETLVLPSFEADRQAALAAQLTTRVKELAGDDPAWRTSVIRGDPSAALAELARTVHSPLIVMGIGRHQPLDRLLGVETSLRTIKHAPCPVLAVHPDVEGPFHETVLATDFSPDSAHAAEIAVSLLDASATLHLVHIQKGSAAEDSRERGADVPRSPSVDDKFRRFTAILSTPPSMTVKSATCEGNAAERILDFAVARRADLIVAGRRGIDALTRLVVGSVSTAIVRGAHCSVLITPEPPPADIDRLRRLLTGKWDSANPAEWGDHLAAFSRRNRGRETSVEVDDLFSTEIVESGFVFLGVSYDPDEERIELMLGDPDHATRQVARATGMIDSVVITTDLSGKDVGLRIRHEGGLLVLTFPGA
jgi:nucleotide-binding universal stress UspA family protein